MTAKEQLTINTLEKIKALIKSAPDIAATMIELLIQAIEQDEPPTTTTEEKPKYGE